jgi:hypothetical protein
MRHVLGMAKRHLDLKGAKGPKLELDFLRLAVAVAHLRQTGDDAKGYLLVMSPRIRKRTEAWVTKYETKDTVEVVTADLTESELRGLCAEVRANTEGMMLGTQGRRVGNRSDARSGGRLVEDKLRAMIEVREPGIRRVNDPSKFPLNVQWDYYGVRASVSQADGVGGG